MGIHTKVVSAIGWSLLCVPLASWALTLGDAYRAALENDPYFRSAYYAYQAGSEDANIGRSHLLPGITFNARGADNRGRRETTNRLGTFSDPLDYTSSSSGVYLRQPLISLEKYALFQQGDSQAEMSGKRYLSDQQEAIIRIVSVYLDAVVARVGVDLAEAHLRAIEVQYKQTERMFFAGEAATTDVDTAKIRLQLAEVQRMEFINKYADAQHTIEELTQSTVDKVASFRQSFNFTDDISTTLEQARTQAMAQSPLVREKNLAVALAEQNVNKAMAAYLPSLDLVASYSKSNQDSVATLGQKLTTRAVGLEMQWSLLNGGQTSALTRKAQAQLQQAQQEERIERTKVGIEVSTQYHAVKSTLKKVQVLDDARRAGERSLEAMRMGFRLGVRTLAEAENAQKELVQINYDYADSMRNYLLAVLKLGAAMGELREDKVLWVEGFLIATETHKSRQ